MANGVGYVMSANKQDTCITEYRGVENGTFSEYKWSERLLIGMMAVVYIM